MKSTLVALCCVAGLSVAVACTSRPTYSCAANGACVSETGGRGICESNGFCSFVDTACPEAGRRYSDGAGASLDSLCVSAPAAQKCIATLGLGSKHTCAVKTDGTLWCWGSNDKGQLGDGTTVSRPAPTRVGFPPGVKIAQVSAAEFHTCARDTSGGIWCWGDNAVGQLGVDVPESKTPMQVPMVLGTAPVAATSLALGGKHSCAVGNHQVFCWGENGDGQCGVAPSPGNDDVKKPTAVADLDGVDEVAPGDEFTCALRDDRSVFCWGANAQGELGNGTRLPSATPLKVGLPSVAHLSAGDEHACGAKDDGSVWCWGYGQSGSVGSGVKDDKLLPVAVGMSAKKVYSSGQAFHACAVTADGTLKCWGANDTQQVGVPGAGDSVLSPEAVDLVTVSQVGIGGKHSCALTFDGALWCWGSNEAGQLGTGSAGASVPTPQRIPFACP